MPRAAVLLVALELAPALAVQTVWRSTPSLRDVPVAIAEPGRPVLALCPRAAAAGVAPGQSAAQARLRCPALLIVPPDRDAAPLLWEELLAALSGVSPRVEAADPAAGVAYLDARGLEGVWGDGIAVARAALRALDGPGLTARAGAGPLRAVALALARRMGQEGPRMLTGDDAHTFVQTLPIDDPTLGLPPTVTAALHELGIRTAGAFAALPPSGLGLRFGPTVLAAWRLVTSEEEPPLRPWSAPETVAVTHQMEDGLADAVLLEQLLGVLSADLARRLAIQGVAAALLTVDVRCDDDARQAARTRCWPPVSTVTALRTTALALLARLHLRAPIGAVTLQASELRRPEVRQEALWDTHPLQRRRERLAGVLAAQRQRHEHLRLRRLRPDPVSEEGWRVEDLEPDG